jgi:hypothetical protein
LSLPKKVIARNALVASQKSNRKGSACRFPTVIVGEVLAASQKEQIRNKNEII